MQRLHDPRDSQFRATLEALIRTTKAGHDDFQAQRTLEALIRTTKAGHDDFQAQRNLWQTLYGEQPPESVATQPSLL